MTEPIAVVAEVTRIQTLADGGIRWTFDVPETAIFQSASLMEFKRSGVAVRLEMTPTEIETTDDIWEDVGFG